MTSIRSLGKTVLIYGLAAGLSKSIMIFLVPLFTRYFSSEEYGILDVINTSILFITIVSMLQLESAISRYFYEAKDKMQLKTYISTTFWAIIAVSAIGGLVVFALSDWLSLQLFETRDYGYIILSGAAIVPLANLFGLFSTLMRFRKEPWTFMLFVVIQLIITVGITIWFVTDGETGIIGAIYGQVLGFLLADVAMIIYFWRYLFTVPEVAVLTMFYRFSLPMVPVTLGNWMNASISRYVMLSFMTLADIRLYTVAIKIASVFKLLDQALRMSWVPFMYEKLKEEDHRKVFNDILKIISVGILLLVAAFALVSTELLHLFSTENYYEAGTVINLLALSFGLNIIYSFVGIGALIVKKTIYTTAIFFVSLAVNMGILFAFTSSYGLEAVAAGVLIGSLTLVALGWMITERVYYIGFSVWYFIIPFTITAAVVVGMLTFELDLIIRLAILVGISILAGGFLLYRIRSLKTKG